MKTRLMLAAAAGALATATFLPVEPALAQNAATTAPAPAARDAAAEREWAIAYFANDSALPFHAPDFTRLSDDIYGPAME